MTMNDSTKDEINNADRTFETAIRAMAIGMKVKPETETYARRILELMRLNRPLEQLATLDDGMLAQLHHKFVEVTKIIDDKLEDDWRKQHPVRAFLEQDWVGEIAMPLIAILFFAVPAFVLYLIYETSADLKEWFYDSTYDWFDRDNTRQLFAWASTVTTWATLALVLIFHRRLLRVLRRAVLGAIRSTRRAAKRIEEETRP